MRLQFVDTLVFEQRLYRSACYLVLALFVTFIGFNIQFVNPQALVGNALRYGGGVASVFFFARSFWNLGKIFLSK